MNGFDITESKRCPVVKPETEVEVYEGKVMPKPAGGERLMNAVADNFDTILNLVTQVADIQKMKVQSDAVIAQMRETRENLLAEAKVYVDKKNADTRSVVEKMEIIRSMMNDFYEHGSQNLTSEDFCRIITEIVNQMGRIENGG